MPAHSWPCRSRWCSFISNGSGGFENRSALADRAWRPGNQVEIVLLPPRNSSKNRGEQLARHGISGRVDVLPTAGMVEETYNLFGDGFRASVTCPFGPQLGWRCFRYGRLVEAEKVPAEMPEDIVNGCYDEAAAFLVALRGGTPKPSIAEVFPSVELCFAIARAANAAAAR